MLGALALTGAARSALAGRRRAQPGALGPATVAASWARSSSSSAVSPASSTSRCAPAQSKQVEAEEEEMLRMMELEDDEGKIEDDERKMIRGVFGLEETTVREIMTPRIDICAVDTGCHARRTR